MFLELARSGNVSLTISVSISLLIDFSSRINLNPTPVGEGVQASRDGQNNLPPPLLEGHDTPDATAALQNHSLSTYVHVASDALPMRDAIVEERLDTR